MLIDKQKILPHGWSYVTLQNVCDIIGGSQPPKECFVYEPKPGYIRLIQIQDYKSDKNKTYIPEALAKRFCTEDDIMIGRYGPPIFQILRGLKGSYNVALMKANPKNDKVLNKGYLYYFLQNQTLLNYIISNSSRTAGQDGVRKELLDEYPIPLPPLPEQKRIAVILEKCDRLRRTRRYSIQLSETFLQSVFLEMFGDPATNPMGWDKSFLEQISEVQGGIQLSQKRENLPLKLPYLRVANVYRNKLELSEIKTISLTENEFRRVKLQKNDILIVEGHGNTEEIGRCAVWNGSIENCVHQNHLIRVRVNPKIINSAYLSYYINNSGGRKYFHNSSNTTSGLNTISTGIVKQCIVPLPPLPLQEKFAQIVQKHDRFRTQQREAERQAEHLFQTLLHRAFRGELTSSDCNDVDISALSAETHPQQPKPKSTDKAENFPIPATQRQTNALQLTLPGLE
ncbi:restriction endonuclease subunit S [Anabaena cylindrica FACHB-243]|uniref:Restriction modification system DNA specificity domain protein n=1 Tax=Anabaena cylindrica (strain ATCC 27899 / PCC 7122) TaxID=272123 RepID=K9ZC82_ANACC|nr:MULTISPECIES: restriction endonuclease subunit S [Anabaena]AFZ56192.1 restriction modification system DNA specificity domain protein [Anabaena cylindrica PCC 7122]MBD2417420.1 restriction endonuclease subunit S [Anabaena cylindrica FACHB-243]MBY5284424.1 restriction endonuclease subunit S [Anabaena sp. CCAP 1446/1C]MBY5306259.1 restriction endonuclease subunit S [Anabaena sp. CCAP 1446/1C]MCM2407589.1 restriction endonuclease subunit S [Anabaena sp. CCAP 1446/1C]